MLTHSLSYSTKPTPILCHFLEHDREQSSEWWDCILALLVHGILSLSFKIHAQRDDEQGIHGVICTQQHLMWTLPLNCLFAPAMDWAFCPAWGLFTGKPHELLLLRNQLLLFIFQGAIWDHSLRKTFLMPLYQHSLSIYNSSFFLCSIDDTLNQTV